MQENEWLKYLESDSNSKWADEARQHLREIQESQHRISGTQNQDLEEFLRSTNEDDDERAWAIIGPKDFSTRGRRNYSSVLGGAVPVSPRGRIIRKILACDITERLIHPTMSLGVQRGVICVV